MPLDEKFVLPPFTAIFSRITMFVSPLSYAAMAAERPAPPAPMITASYDSLVPSPAPEPPAAVSPDGAQPVRPKLPSTPRAPIAPTPATKLRRVRRWGRVVAPVAFLSWFVIPSSSLFISPCDPAFRAEAWRGPRRNVVHHTQMLPEANTQSGCY